MAIIKLPSDSTEGDTYTVKYRALYESSLYESEDSTVVMPDYVSADEDKYLVLDEFSVTVI